jgi:hypothetical protein
MSDCGCVYVGDYEPAEVAEEQMRKACVRHECCECGRTIIPGEQYEAVFMVWDGSPHRYKTCQDCLSLRYAFFCNGLIYQSTWADWREALFDSGGAVDWMAMEKLTPRAKAKALEIIQDVWNDMEDDD